MAPWPWFGKSKKKHLFLFSWLGMLVIISLNSAIATFIQLASHWIAYFELTFFQKVSVRDRNSSGARRGSYHNDRSDNHGDREGKWNNSSKSRAAGRHHSRSQTEKSSSQLQSHSQNGPSHSDSSHAPPNMAYSMYQLPVMNPSGISSNGQTHPSVVMLYPFDHNASYKSHAEQLEFGSLGPVGFTCTNERQLSEGSQAKEQRFHRASVLRSSPDQPSSPHLQR